MKKIIVLAVFLLFTCNVSAQINLESDDYLHGFIKASLLKDYGLDIELNVRDGKVFLPESLSAYQEYELILKDIETMDGVKSVVLVDGSKLENAARWVFMPADPLFKPLLADNRWPRFSASYHHYNGDTDYEHAFDASFGKSFSIVRTNICSALVDVGLQGAVYSVFDLGVHAFDLINTDYFVGLTITAQKNNWTLMLRTYHQSSHVGDDYIREGRMEAPHMNLSYEVVDLLVSYEFTQNIRVYGGGGRLFDVDPSSIDKWLYQFGAECYIFSDSVIAPDYIFAVDIKGWEETDYKPGLSARAGMFKGSVLISLDYYTGNSPHGQFYADRVSWIGAGISFY